MCCVIHFASLGGVLAIDDPCESGSDRVARGGVLCLQLTSGQGMSLIVF